MSETLQMELEGSNLFREQFIRLSAIPNLNEITIEAGSILEGDRKVNAYDPIHDQVIYLSEIARAHLQHIQDHLEATNSLPNVPTYSLLRAAIEASARAIWLLSAGIRDKRIFRSLQFIKKSRLNIEPLAEKLGIANAEGYRRMTDRLSGIQASLKSGYNTKSLDTPLEATKILIDADRFVPKRELSGLIVWQACSALTHGNRYASLTLLEHVEVRRVGSVAHYAVSASVLLSAQMFQIAVDYLEATQVLFARRSAKS